MIERYNSQGQAVSTEKYRAEVSDKMYDISEVLDHGNVPDWDKDELSGTVVTVVGVVGPEEYNLGDVYFVLLYRDGDDHALDAWGVMIPASSPFVKQCLAMARQGYLPFRTGIEKRDSAQHRGQSYWVAFKPAIQATLPEKATKK